MVAWLITHDFATIGKRRLQRFSSTEFTEEDGAACTSRFRLYDHDGFLMYEGICTPDTEREPLEAVPECSAIRILQSTGEWR